MELMQIIKESSPIAKALHHAAYARQEDVTALLALLQSNPNLLLQTGNVKTPGGHEIREVTIYEFLLGAGDYELAKMVQGYFAEIDGGEEERVRQYGRYKPYIDNLLNQKPYDLSPLIELIKKATPQEIQALLNKDRSGETVLCKALDQFRKDWAPQVLTTPCMHYNYASLKHTFEILAREWDSLYQTSGNNYDMIDLVWRQLIGFEMRRLPGIDRCVMAQSLYGVIEENKDCTRSYTFKDYYLKLAHAFPITDCDDSFDGLGGDFSVSIFAGRVFVRATDAPGWWLIGKLMSNKNIKLAELMHPQPAHQQSPCVIF
ncbi:Uncharacterised protein [Legionella donaldsonii]|uniref:SidC homolog n=2 Tax=Legionella donaldsonii TaxID=45060 RepID=A0A378J2K9_9GAMM|nr:Uncharacterised protein [Legionella donaldsonii]